MPAGATAAGRVAAVAAVAAERDQRSDAEAEGLPAAAGRIFGVLFLVILVGTRTVTVGRALGVR